MQLKLYLFSLLVFGLAKSLVSQPTPIPNGPTGTAEKLDSGKFQSRTVWIPYWSEKDSHHATLHLRNSLHHANLNASIDVFALEGGVLASRPVVLERMGNLDISMGSLIPTNTPDSSRAGSIRIIYSYPYDGVLQAELSIRDDKNNHAYTIVGRRSYTGNSKAAYLALNAPTGDTYLEAAFLNPTPSPVNVTLSVRDSAGWAAIRTFALSANESEKVKITANTLTGRTAVVGAWTALLKAEYSVSTTEIVSNAWLEDEKTGFSNTALFHDEFPQSNTLFATQLVSRSFPASILANGPSFDGTLVFVNVGETSSDLSGTVFCDIDSVITEIPVPSLRMEPFRPQTVSVESLVSLRSNRPAICNGRFQFTGKPGHVIGRYYAASQSKSFGLYIKMEPFVGRAYNEVYWTIQDDFVPLLSISNFADAEDEVVVWVTQAGLLVELAREKVSTRGTLTLNLREKIASRRSIVPINTDFGGMYIRTTKPDGRLLVKQHAMSARRLMMAPYYGGFDYITSHSFNSAPSNIDVKQVSSASVTTCQSSTGCHYDEWFIYSSNTSQMTVSNTYGVQAPRPVTGVAAGTPQLESGASGPIDSMGTNGTVYATPAQVQVNLQIPYKVTIVSGTNNQGGEIACVTGGLPGCGNTRTFRYQVRDVRDNTIERGGMVFTDTISTTDPNTCFLTTYDTTPPGQSTDSSGRFDETLRMCAPACRSGATCITGCETKANQIWTVAGVQLTNDQKTLSYKCDGIKVNGQ